MRAEPPRRKLTAKDFAARFEAEKARLQRRYCDAFALWLTCRRRRCRRRAACCGNPDSCLKRALDLVPHLTQWQERQNILAATPANIGAPEYAARRCMPRDFYPESTVNAGAAASHDG